jgi:hypothetical protein
VDVNLVRHDADGKCLLDVTLSNRAAVVALMTHLQLRREDSAQRVLPVYYSDNYVSLLPGESRTISIEAALADLGGENPLVVLDGWNITTKTQTFSSSSGETSVAINGDAQVDSYPQNGLRQVPVPPMPSRFSTTEPTTRTTAPSY